MTATRPPLEDEDGQVTASRRAREDEAARRCRRPSPSSAAGSSCPARRSAAAGLVAAGAVGYELPHRSGSRAGPSPAAGGAVLRRPATATLQSGQQDPGVPHPSGSAAARRAGDASWAQPALGHAALHRAGADERGADLRAPAGPDDARPPGPPGVVLARSGGTPFNLDVQSYAGRPALDLVAGVGVQRARLRGGEIGDDTFHPIKTIRAGHGLPDRPARSAAHRPRDGADHGV